MELAYIIQVRMNSKRLPGKVLKPIGGKPMLQYLLESIQVCKHAGRLIVATSHRDTDNPIADYCAAMTVECFRGSLVNVASRYAEIIRQHRLDAFVRICGDSPLLDHRLVDQGVTLFTENRPDVVTNVLPRSYPRGQSVEVVNARTFTDTFKDMTTTSDLEHVTQYFYRHKNDFSIMNFSASRDCAHIQLAVDDTADLDRTGAIVARLAGPHWKYEWENYIALIDNN